MKNIHQLEESERQPCEVWTRVMGYHRPVSQFNRGKKEEHAERRHFVEHPLASPSTLNPR
jgi:hypothetical protein